MFILFFLLRICHCFLKKSFCFNEVFTYFYFILNLILRCLQKKKKNLDKYENKTSILNNVYFINNIMCSKDVGTINITYY